MNMPTINDINVELFKIDLPKLVKDIIFSDAMHNCSS